MALPPNCFKDPWRYCRVDSWRATGFCSESNALNPPSFTQRVRIKKRTKKTMTFAYVCTIIFGPNLPPSNERILQYKISPLLEIVFQAVDSFRQGYCSVLNERPQPLQGPGRAGRAAAKCAAGVQEIASIEVLRAPTSLWRVAK